MGRLVLLLMMVASSSAQHSANHARFFGKANPLNNAISSLTQAMAALTKLGGDGNESRSGFDYGQSGGISNDDLGSTDVVDPHGPSPYTLSPNGANLYGLNVAVDQNALGPQPYGPAERSPHLYWPTHYGPFPYEPTQHSPVQYVSPRHGSFQYGPKQHGSFQYGPGQHGSFPYRPIQHGSHSFPPNGPQ